MRKIKAFFPKGYQLIPYIFFLVFFLIALVTYFKITSLLTLIALIIILFLSFYMNGRFLKDSSGNGIIFGGRGKGKGILLQKKINSQKKVFSNVPYGSNTELINIREYIQSIGSNTILDTINGTVKIVKKIEKYEGVNVFWDDLTVYAPNFMDNELKKMYPSLPLTLAINRHLYGAYMLITSQALERPYKILRELQTDFSIKALKTVGFGWLWSSIPLIRFFVVVKYRFYEETKAAESGILPFSSAGLINKGLSPAYITAGQATKDVYQATNGRIYHGYVVIRKNKLYYDTRYFHQLFYGYKSPKNTT